MILSVFGGGLFLIPLILFGASGWFTYVSYRASKSGSWYWGKDANGVAKKIERDENIPIWKVPQFIYAAAFFVAGVATVFLMISDK